MIWSNTENSELCSEKNKNLFRPGGCKHPFKKIDSPFFKECHGKFEKVHVGSYNPCVGRPLDGLHGELPCSARRISLRSALCGALWIIAENLSIIYVDPNV